MDDVFERWPFLRDIEVPVGAKWYVFGQEPKLEFGEAVLFVTTIGQKVSLSYNHNTSDFNSWAHTSDMNEYFPDIESACKQLALIAFTL